MTGNSIVLKPCPFCGTPPEVDVCDRLILIKCPVCNYTRGFEGIRQSKVNTGVPIVYTGNITSDHEWYDKDAKTKAYAAWNRRTPEPARLITAEDFENNPNVTEEEIVPCWVEWSPSEKDNGRQDCWGICSRRALQHPEFRCWSRKPSIEQMKATPWPEEDACPASGLTYMEWARCFSDDPDYFSARQRTCPSCGRIGEPTGYEHFKDIDSAEWIFEFECENGHKWDVCVDNKEVQTSFPDAAKKNGWLLYTDEDGGSDNA